MVSRLQITYFCLVKTQKTAEFHYEMYYCEHHKRTKFPCHDQGHLFAMEVSSGEEYYIASDNTGTPLAVFSSNGQMIKQVIHTVHLDLSLFPLNSRCENSKCSGLTSLENSSRLNRELLGCLSVHEIWF